MLKLAWLTFALTCLTVSPLLGVVTSPTVHRARCLAVLADIALMRNDSRTTMKRPLSDYLTKMGPALEKRLQALGAMDHILDFGAGDGLAMGEYLGLDGTKKDQASLLRLGPLYQRANVTVFSYDMDERKRVSYRERSQGKLRMVTGEFAEHITSEQLMGTHGRISLAICHWGVLAYTPDPTQVIRTLLGAMADDSVLILRTGPREYEFTSFFGRQKSRSSLYRSIVRGGSEDITFPDWLASFRGWNARQEAEFMEILIPTPRDVIVPNVYFDSVDTLGVMPGARYFDLAF